MANTETKVDLVINRMSQSKYEQLKSAGQLDPNQIYMTTDGTDPVPETRKVNGQTLEADVNLTGADIAVSTSDSTKINAALAGKQSTLSTQQLQNIAAVPNKLDKSGGTVVGTLGIAGPEQPELKVFEVIPSADGSDPTMRFGDGAGVIGL